MGLFDEKMWEILEEKVTEEDSHLPLDKRIGNEYLTAVKSVCNYGLGRSKTIRDTFPLYTLHDETHIIGVVRLMHSLLGDHIKNITRDETAMLIMSACCHDIGMSYNEEEKNEQLKNSDRLIKYLESNQKEYVEAFASNDQTPEMTPEITQNYLRSIHHERVDELLGKFPWPDILYDKIFCKALTSVCKSHGQNVSCIEKLKPTKTVDLRFCAILLRLSDILDFNSDRAPQAIYEYSDFLHKNDTASKYSQNEWDKHLSSNGFDFDNISKEERQYPYEVYYTACCHSMQIEQCIQLYLDWVDKELNDCSAILSQYTGKHNKLILPRKVKRDIISQGYLSGEYRLTLDQDQVVNLLVGRNLYNDPGVFVRELLQNAIDATRTREQLDNYLPRYWKPQINISSWMDQEGYHWFRIEDNGIGMTEDIIKEYFLKVGRSYYASDSFKKDKLRNKANMDYMPISRFGIGVLSCFMCGENNIVEISTKHYRENGKDFPSIRMRMEGLKGYYYLASQKNYHDPGEMKGRTKEEKMAYLEHPGTVIAVRTNLYQTGKYRSFKEIVDKYVLYPPVPIRYVDDEGSYEYITKEKFVDIIHDIKPSDNLNEQGVLEFPLAKEKIDEICHVVPQIVFSEPPVLRLKCVALDDFTEHPSLLSGAILVASCSASITPIKFEFGNFSSEIEPCVSIKFKDHVLSIEINAYFSDEFKNSVVRWSGSYFNMRRQKYYPNRQTDQNDDFIAEISRAVRHDSINDEEWIDYMINKYELTHSEFRKKLNDSLKSLGISYNELQAYHTYRYLEHGWKFDLCNLADYDWYKTLFEDVLERTKMYNITSHNGIFCGDATFFRKKGESWEDENKLATILLLQDKYRPEVDISRDCIRQLPIQLLCELEFIRKRLKLSGFKFEPNNTIHKNANYSFISVKHYKALLDERQDFIKYLRFKTNKGILNVVEFESLIEQEGALELTSFPSLKVHDYSYDSAIICDFLALAYLQSNYILEFDWKKSSIIVKPISSDRTNCVKELLPPTLFLYPTNATKILTTSYWERKTCNASHPLSQFIINNCEQLEKKVPGVFHEIIRSLAEDDKDNLILRINDLLKRLRSLPELGIDVGVNLVISEKDFK